jgi:hypothetical protein
MLASAVLIMESFTLGFALLLAMKSESSGAVIYGASIAILLILSVGFLKSKSGWIFASALQIAMLAFGFVLPAFFIVGTLFVGLWITAILVGRKGEAIRASLLATRPPDA